MRTILITDDDPQVRFFLGKALEEEDREVDMATDGQSAIEMVESRSYEVAILDVRLPDMNGLEVLKRITKLRPRLIPIVITAFGSRDIAVDALRKGAYDYLTKPIEADELNIIVERALRRAELEKQVDELTERLQGRPNFGALIGENEEYVKVLRRLEKICKTDSPVLLTGETGTGKELAACAIHDHSPRASHPLVKVNCAAVPASLAESELFGHTEGAFTGADTEKDGKFQAADGGTLFLDEIGDLPLDLQAKLLRALEQNEVEKVGRTQPETIDVRFIGATNKNLQEIVGNGQMRQDLYYRLAVFETELPPLRQRRDDIPLLARHFIHQSNDWLDKDITDISPVALGALATYDWPGNVRELKNCIEAAAAFVEDNVISLDDLPAYIREEHQEPPSTPPSGGLPLNAVLERVEKHMVESALRKAEGVQRVAADYLSISERGVWYRVEKYGIEVRDYKGTDHD